MSQNCKKTCGACRTEPIDEDCQNVKSDADCKNWQDNYSYCTQGNQYWVQEFSQSYCWQDTTNELTAWKNCCKFTIQIPFITIWTNQGITSSGWRSTVLKHAELVKKRKGTERKKKKKGEAVKTIVNTLTDVLDGKMMVTVLQVCQYLPRKLFAEFNSMIVID